MATCKECLHADCYDQSLEDAETCNFFLDKEDYQLVVRCKDCKRWTPGKARGGDSLDDMQIIGGCPLSNFMRREKDFCSFGERRTDATD